MKKLLVIAGILLIACLFMGAESCKVSDLLCQLTGDCGIPPPPPPPMPMP